MPTKSWIGCLLLILSSSVALAAENQRPASPLVVSATAAGEKIRFTAPNGGTQIRVEILSPSGDPLFDSSWREGNVIDWRFDDSVAGGSYRCLIMVKDLDGGVTQKEVTLTVEEGKLSIEPRPDLAGPKITVLAHDGQTGMVVSTRGDLSFRFGDFLSGKETEAMRLTPDGALHVNGYVYSKGLMLPDGTLLSPDDATPGIVRQGAPLASVERKQITSTALKPKADFTPGYQFVVDNSGVRVGTTNPDYKLDVTGVINTASSYQIAGIGVLSAGSSNVFLGRGAGAVNTGTGNTFIGTQTGQLNSTGGGNSFLGYQTGASNTTGTLNAFFGYLSGVFATGSDNTFIGGNVAGNTTTGAGNTALGRDALALNTTGSSNIALGFGAGLNLTTGSNNILIGNAGTAAEANTIRIGSGAQTRAFIAGISGVTTGGSAVPVLIDANGQLGTASSSRRYKFEIADMQRTTDALMDLRPVTFRYLSQGGDAPRQYGLIAEEVAAVYPEMVARNNDGDPEAVLYQFLAPMLLNEVQKQHQTIEQQQKTIEALERRLEAMEKRTR